MDLSPHRDELVAFFTGAESASGLVSSWTALVGIALGGTGGTRDPEARITDRRFQLGPAGRTAISRTRDVRAALVKLSDRHQAVLFAAHGPVAWSKYLDAVFGKPTGARVTAKLGNLVGVALLTETVAEGFARDRAPPVVSDGLNEWEQVFTGRDAEPRYRCRGPAKPLHDPEPEPRLRWKVPPRVYANEGGWLVDVCLSERPALVPVQRESAELLAQAEAAYVHTRGEVAVERAQLKPRRARTPAWDPFALPGGRS